jgi:hypothetical protein
MWMGRLLLQLRLEVHLEMCSWKLEAGCSVLDYTSLTESSVCWLDYTSLVF